MKRPRVAKPTLERAQARPSDFSGPNIGRDSADLECYLDCEIRESWVKPAGQPGWICKPVEAECWQNNWSEVIALPTIFLPAFFCLAAQFLIWQDAGCRVAVVRLEEPN